MKRELRDRWITALRSGEYRQGKESLCRLYADEPAYCCLGVLAKLEGRLVQEDLIFRTPDGQGTSYDSLEHYEVLDLYHNGTVRGHQPYAIIADMNDSSHPFHVIADYIERFIPVED